MICVEQIVGDRSMKIKYKLLLSVIAPIITVVLITVILSSISSKNYTEAVFKDNRLLSSAMEMDASFIQATSAVLDYVHTKKPKHVKQFNKNLYDYEISLLHFGNDVNTVEGQLEFKLLEDLLIRYKDLTSELIRFISNNEAIKTVHSPLKSIIHERMSNKSTLISQSELMELSVVLGIIDSVESAAYNIEKINDDGSIADDKSKTVIEKSLLTLKN